MSNITNVNQVIAVNQDGAGVLGKVLFYSLSSILVEKDALQELCDSMDFPVQPSKRVSQIDAFRSATADIQERRSVRVDGGVSIYKVYCRDNRQLVSGTISRELVKESLGLETNQYKKLGNISFNKADNQISCDNLVSDEHVDALACCQQVEELFDRYQNCAGVNQIDTMLTNFVESLGASKLQARGRTYFIPRDQMHKLDLFEDFVEGLENVNVNTSASRTPLSANSMYVVDDAKQREKMSAAFYYTIQKQIQDYQERIDKLIKGGCTSQAVTDRWVLKIQGLEEKRQNYEGVLQRELHDVDSEFDTLRYLSEELRVQALSAQAAKRAA